MMDSLALYKSGEAVGLKTWSDDWLGKVLAFASATGFQEFTVNGPMQGVLKVAGYRFGLEGGRVPNVELMNEVFYPRLRELTVIGAKATWVREVAERYHITDWEKLDYGFDF